MPSTKSKANEQRPPRRSNSYSPRLPVLGHLSFIEGDRPGSNLTYVEADSLAAIASLQHRLNELKSGARIVIA